MSDVHKKMPDYKTIELQIERGIGRLTLNRPDSLNAFNETMTAEMQSALGDLSGNAEVRCVAITGRGRAFSSGQDLKEIAAGSSFAESLKRRYNPVVRMIAGMQKPVVALINGVAAGAGMSLALACDFKMMSSNAKFIQAFVKIGLVPDAGSSFFLPHTIGYGKAFELAALGDEVSAEEALNLGIVNRVFPEDKFAEETEAILARFANGPTKAYSLIKRMFYRSIASALDQSLDYEAGMQEIAGRSEDAQEALRAFIDKRPPVFKGE